MYMYNIFFQLPPLIFFYFPLFYNGMLFDILFYVYIFNVLKFAFVSQQKYIRNSFTILCFYIYIYFLFNIKQLLTSYEK